MAMVSSAALLEDSTNLIISYLDKEGVLYGDLQFVKTIYSKLPNSLIKSLQASKFIGKQKAMSYYKTLGCVMNSFLKTPCKTLDMAYKRANYKVHDCYLKVQSFIEAMYKVLELLFLNVGEEVDVFERIDRRAIISKLTLDKSEFLRLTKLVVPLVDYRNSITHVNFAQEYSCDFLMMELCIKFYQLFFDSRVTQNLIYKLIEVEKTSVGGEGSACAKRSHIF